jgi:molecular chaperone GrpE (heat shock protein)
MSGYVERLIGALLGKAEQLPVATDAQTAARIASLEMDLKERDMRIDGMRAEYAALRAECDRAATTGGEEQVQKLLKKLAGPLSNLAALAAHAEAGEEVAARDMAALFRSVEKELARAGLERLGTVGEKAGFDASVHQRMSGDDVHQSTEIQVRVPGYRLGTKTVLKALVTTRTAEGDRHE